LTSLGDRKEISLLLGDKITDIKMFYEATGENGWLDSVLSYICLEKNGVIFFPSSGDDDFENVTLDTRALPINKKAQSLVIGQTIKELYYEFDEDDEPNTDWYAFIELKNGHVIHENRMAPNGTGAANLFLYSQEQFLEKRNSGDYNLKALTTILSREK
jgi:hypothetical protein